MQSVAYLSIVLALATLALASSQPQQVDPVQASGNQASPVQVESVQVVPQQQQSPVVSVPVHPSQVGPESHGPQVGLEHQHHQVGVEHQHHQVGVEHQHHQVGVEHQHHQVPVHHQQQQPFPSYYAPAGLIQVIGGEQQQQQGQVVGGNKPIVGRSSASPSSPVVAEQYGQPESAALPANYKPFGSWGLYIGGNPADGYYTNYYKQLSSSVEKQQQAGGVQQVSGEQTVKPTSALSPMLKQASGMSPFSGGDYYPFAYSMNDLSSATMPRSYVPPQQQQQAPSMFVAAPQRAQASVEDYCSNQSFCNNFAPPVVTVGHENGVSSYSGPVSYAPAPVAFGATKKFGSSYVQQKEQTKVAEYPAVVEQPAKGYNQPQYQQYQQSRYFVYPQQVGPMSAPVAYRQVSVAAAAAPVAAAPVHHQQQQVQHQQHQQVVAYPVPVGSQIVGSQAGVDGAFAPYGVHAFTRYAVKPTVVSGAEQNYHYGVSSNQMMPTYKQQQNQQMGYYYGYPMNQLHHSQGSIVPAVHEGEQSVYQHVPSSGLSFVGGSQVEASEKSETSSKSGTTTTNTEDNKSQVNNNKQQQQQKRA